MPELLLRTGSEIGPLHPRELAFSSTAIVQSRVGGRPVQEITLKRRVSIFPIRAYICGRINCVRSSPRVPADNINTRNPVMLYIIIRNYKQRDIRIRVTENENDSLYRRYFELRISFSD